MYVARGRLVEKAIVASPVPPLFVSVPLAAGAPVAVVKSCVAPAIVAITVNVCALFVYVAPAVAFAEVTVNRYPVVAPVAVSFVTEGAFK